MMRKGKIVFIFILFLTVFALPLKVDAASKAKTLAELRSELAALKSQQKANDNKKNATKNEINTAKSNVTNKQNEIITNQQKISDSIAESEQLEIEIAEGKEELTKLVKSYQLAKADNVYLEYVFKATSYEDLVYRLAVIEQIMDKQEKTITEYKNKIEYNKQLKVDLEAREVTLNQQIDALASDIKSLNNKLASYMDISMDIKDEISSTQELINYYSKMGCKENQDLNECVKVLGDTGWLRPLNKGVTTSLFGYRKDPITGKSNSFHSGIDLAGNSEGTNVYSAANGMVGKIIRKASCGGNQVYIYHTINGKLYTTAYLHLLTINVSTGQRVTNQTVIGTVGGGKGTRSWERCSTGSHLHFGLGTGWYGSTYTAYSKWVANLQDPKGPFKLPNKGKYFYSRMVA